MIVKFKQEFFPDDDVKINNIWGGGYGYVEGVDENEYNVYQNDDYELPPLYTKIGWSYRVRYRTINDRGRISRWHTGYFDIENLRHLSVEDDPTIIEPVKRKRKK